MRLQALLILACLSGNVWAETSATLPQPKPQPGSSSETTKGLDTSAFNVSSSSAGQTKLFIQRIQVLEESLKQLKAELQTVRNRDSLMARFCDELESLKAENRSLRALLEARPREYVSIDESGFLTDSMAEGSSSIPSPTSPAGSLLATGEEEAGSKLQFSGFVDAAGSFERNSKSTELSLNQVELDVEKGVSDRASFRADVEVNSGGTDGYSMVLEQGFVKFAPTRSHAWHVIFGRFNSPVGIERSDPPDTYLYTRGFIFEHGLPSEITGFMTTLQLSQKFDLAVLAVNGWDLNIDNNAGKTFGTRLGITPSPAFNFGVSVLSGPERDNDNASKRTVFDLDATCTSGETWNANLELHHGQETGSLENGGTATWDGAVLIGHSHLGGRLWVTARADYFNDVNGSRTGTSQELKGLALAPALSIVEGLDLIWELRQNWSNRNSFGVEGSERNSEFSSALEFVYSF